MWKISSRSPREDTETGQDEKAPRTIVVAEFVRHEFVQEAHDVIVIAQLAASADNHVTTYIAHPRHALVPLRRAVRAEGVSRDHDASLELQREHARASHVRVLRALHTVRITGAIRIRDPPRVRHHDSVARRGTLALPRSIARRIHPAEPAGHRTRVDARRCRAGVRTHQRQPLARRHGTREKNARKEVTFLSSACARGPEATDATPVSADSTGANDATEPKTEKGRERERERESARARK